jgi:hypothetical protein
VLTNPAVVMGGGALAGWRGDFADFLDFLATNGGAHRQIEARDFVFTPAEHGRRRELGVYSGANGSSPKPSLAWSV